MSLLANVSKGVIDSPKMTCIYGVNKIGKTTFVAEFPNHIILDLEKGSNSVSKANRLQKDHWTVQDIKTLTEELLTTDHNYKVLAIDSVEALADVIEHEICVEHNVKSLAAIPYGKGADQARVVMGELLHLLMKLKDQKGMSIFLIGHALSKTMTDAMTDAQYERYSLRANEKMTSVIFDLCDNILFVCRDFMQAKRNGQDVTVSDGKPYIYTTWTKGAVAGNRSGLPPKIELDHTAYVRALELGKTREKSLEEVKTEVAQMIEGLDKETRPKVQESLNKATTMEKVVAIKARVHELIAA